MRDMRFRAWDKIGKKMYFDGLFIGLDGDYSFNPEIMPKGYNPLEFEVMQWTGLLDRNGKEIYENDIVRVYEHEFSPMNFIIKWSEVNLGWELESVNRDLYGTPVKWFDYSSLNGFESDSEVISNTYEARIIKHKIILYK